MMCSKQTLCCLFFLLIVAHGIPCLAHKILLVSVPWPSHIFRLTAVGRELLSRGHDVHMLVRAELELSMKLLTKNSSDGSNATQRMIRPVRYTRQPDDDIEDPNVATAKLCTKTFESKGDVSTLLPILKNMCRNECRLLLLNNEATMEQLRNEKYDLIILDSFLRCFHLIPHRLGVPHIALTDFEQPWLIRVPWPPSFVPLRLLPFTERMNFFERLKNTLMTVMHFAFHPLAGVDEDIVEKYREYGEYDSVDELTSKSLLWITGHLTVLDYPKPSMPNMVDAGEITVEPSSDENIPSDIASFIENAERGVILVTFGSMVEIMPVEIVEKFVAAFRDFRQYHIIWRLNNTDNVELPENVKLWRWLPQNDILGHTKTKLFISHCGVNGQMETIYHGVPMIGFPFFVANPYYGQRIQYHGYGIAMNLYDFTVDQLVSNIRTVLEDPSYSNRVQKASMIIKSSPMKPAERVVYWIEHVMTFGGDHLRSAGNDLPLYQYLMLDIVACLFVVMSVMATCAWKMLTLIIRKLCIKYRPSVLKDKSD